MVFILCCSNSSLRFDKKINWRNNTQFDSEDKYRTGFSKCQSLSTTTVLFRATFSRLAMMFILKHSKSTWRQLTILRKLQNQNIKSSGHNACSALLYHWNVQERSIYDNCCFHIESFRASRLITKVSTHEWHICISQTTQKLVPYATCNLRAKKVSEQTPTKTVNSNQNWTEWLNPHEAIYSIISLLNIFNRFHRLSVSFIIHAVIFSYCL